MALRSDDVRLIGGVPDDQVDVNDIHNSDVDIRRDRELVERCQAGDAAAFDALYRRYHRRLFRFCLQRLRDPHEAEDAAQEAFAKAWRALPTFAGERRFYPWLSVIAANVCVDIQRRRQRLTPVDDAHLQMADVAHDDAEDAVVRAVEAQIVTEAFAKLSSRHQRVLGLREGSGWSYQAIADHEGVGVAAVETLLWRARQALKREFASLAGPETRVGAFVALLTVLPRRLVARLAAPLRHLASATRHVGSGDEPLGRFLPQAAVATGALAVAVGTIVMIPGSPNHPLPPARHLAPPAARTEAPRTPPAATVPASRAPASSPPGGGGAGGTVAPATPTPPLSGQAPVGPPRSTSSGLSNTLNSTSSGLSNTLSGTNSGLLGSTSG